MHFTILSLTLAAYLLYFVYDWLNAARPGLKSGRWLFFAATLLVAGATGLLIYRSSGFAGGLKSFVFLPLAALSFAGMLYAVFFALPSGTYSKPDSRRRAYRGGVYALCRHPGVLTYCLFYGFLYLSMPSAGGLTECAALCAGNLLYMLFQDFWSFPRIFSDYQDYKRETPMFFPTLNSIRRCAASYRKNREN